MSRLTITADVPTLHSEHAHPPVPMREWTYFLDVDGTLVDIAATPHDICFDASLLQELESLRHSTDGAVAFVSGRSIADLDSHLGTSQIPVAGQHGLERRDATGRIRILGGTSPAQTTFCNTLKQHLSRFDGFIVEDKGLSIAVHYRQAPEHYTLLLDLMEQLVEGAQGAMGLLHGKYVVEAVPHHVGKGHAVLEYLHEAPFHGRRPVFIGDDVTDEHAFAAVNKVKGISIKVGDGASCAAYRLPNVAAVREWLSQVRL